MKSIAPAAMAAIEAGEAIVTGAVEIIPRASFVPASDWETIDLIELDAVANCSLSLSGGLTVGVPLSGFDPLDVLRLTLPSGQTYTAWQYDAPSPLWVNEFDVIPDGVAINSFRVSQAGLSATSPSHAPFGYPTAAEARLAFGEQFITGAAAYTFYLCDDSGGNTGGVSVLVERRLSTGSPPPAPDPIRVWGGYGPINIGGNDYQGIGDRGLAQQSAGSLGGFAQGLVLTLSGIEPHVLELLDAEEIRGASVVVRRLIFAADGKSLLDAHIFDRGRVDSVETAEVIGGAAAIKVAVESAARGLGQKGARMRSDSDQRLIDPDDGYFRNTAFAGEKSLYWGGFRPNRASSSGGISSGGGGGFLGGGKGAL